MPAPPVVPDERLAGWRLVDERTDTPFDIKLVTVTAHTGVYEETELTETLRDVTGTDGPGRFFLTSHVVLQPRPPGSGALRRLVTDRVSRDFVTQLRDRGFSAVERTGRRSLSIDGETADLFGYEGTCRLGAVTLDVQGWLAVWVVDGDFLLSGGGYPTGVRSADDEETREAIDALLNPHAFRDELLTLIRATRRS